MIDTFQGLSMHIKMKPLEFFKPISDRLNVAK